MDSFLEWGLQIAQLYTHYTPYIFFILLLLAGLNIPISEDLILISGGVIAAGSNDLFYSLYFWLFLGCYISAWEAYYLGRVLSNWMDKKTVKKGMFYRLFSEKRLEKMMLFYKRWGFFSLFFGRFIPFGARNALFMSIGYAKVPFKRFLLMDLIPALFSSATIFFFSYSVGSNIEDITSIIHQSQMQLMLFLTLLVVSFVFFYYLKRDKKQKNKTYKSSIFTQSSIQ